MGRTNKKYINTHGTLLKKIINVACAIGPNKKIGNPTNFRFQKIYCNLVEFPMTKKNYSKFNISWTLSVKIVKSPSLNPTH
jgi:hypothetical protein